MGKREPILRMLFLDDCNVFDLERFCGLECISDSNFPHPPDRSGFSMKFDTFTLDPEDDFTDPEDCKMAILWANRAEPTHAECQVVFGAMMQGYIGD